MKSRASIAGHPLHPIFVAIPIGLWTTVPFCDLINLCGGGESWRLAALYAAGGGILGAIPALITGYMDYGMIKTAAPAKIATFHLRLNFVVTVLFLISFIIRFRELGRIFEYGAMGITLVGFGLLSLSGWLGGELVSRYGISVHRETKT